jgi:hypothetical protein
MTEQTRRALQALSCFTARLVWVDYRVFEGFIGWFINTAESSDRLPDNVAADVLATGYMRLTEDVGYRRTYKITDAGRAVLTA